MLSRDANLESRNDMVRRKAEERIRRELTFCSHLGEFKRPMDNG